MYVVLYAHLDPRLQIIRIFSRFIFFSELKFFHTSAYSLTCDYLHCFVWANVFEVYTLSAENTIFETLRRKMRFSKKLLKDQSHSSSTPVCLMQQTQYCKVFRTWNVANNNFRKEYFSGLMSVKCKSAECKVKVDNN